MRGLATVLVWLAMMAMAVAQAPPPVNSEQLAGTWQIQAGDGGEGLEAALKRAELSQERREIAAKQGSTAGLTAEDEAFAAETVWDGARDTHPRWKAKASGPSNPLPLAYFGTLLLGCAGLCVWQAARVERRRNDEARAPSEANAAMA